MTAGAVKIAFEREIVVLHLSAILPMKQVPETIRKTAKYRRIAKSVQEIGIIEPIVVAAAKDDKGRFLLLDGHMRYTVLVEAGSQEVRCLIADDDEAFTYNKRVNRLATVQEHYMIVRALERGVSEEKLARALDVNISVLRRRKTLLDGVCPEVIDLLKDKSVNPVTFEVLRKMKPMRQIEAAELMCSASNYSSSYSKALLAATKQSDLTKPERPKRIGGLAPEQMARMEREMESVQRDFKSIETAYGEDVLHLVIASGYLAKLVVNRKIERYLDQHHPELLKQFRAIIAAASLDQSVAAAE